MTRHGAGNKTAENCRKSMGNERGRAQMSVLSCKHLMVGEHRCPDAAWAVGFCTVCLLHPCTAVPHLEHPQQNASVHWLHSEAWWSPELSPRIGIIFIIMSAQ